MTTTTHPLREGVTLAIDWGLLKSESLTVDSWGESLVANCKTFTCPEDEPYFDERGFPKEASK